MAMTQEPIHWRYLAYIKPKFQGCVRCKGSFFGDIPTKYSQAYGTVPPFQDRIPIDVWICHINKLAGNSPSETFDFPMKYRGVRFHFSLKPIR